MLKIVLAVTGSIAAYKAVSVASELVKRGHAVRVILTPGAMHFVTPLTFEAITGQPVATSLWEEQPESPIGHVALGSWGDVLTVVPASADAIAHLALGLADDALGAAALAGRAPLLLAPAMETAMWEHPATQQNVATLRARGARVVGPEAGRLASGRQGFGRMAQPEEIVQVIESISDSVQDLAGKRVLVTAGPTFEAIDDVRFIGNRSSGKMGFALAAVAAERGAEVVLVAGPTALPTPTSVEMVRVESHDEMREAVVQRVTGQDIVIMAAAVADFRPRERRGGKVSRSEGLVIELEPTSDIAAEAAQAAPQAVHVGFALETKELVERARAKMRRKGQQLVVANAVTEDHNPFGAETNRVVILDEDGTTALPEMSKRDVAREVLDRAARLLQHGETPPSALRTRSVDEH